jgi:uncharacterized membrane protein YdjX (TVP38/TMEM64 family)
MSKMAGWYETRRTNMSAKAVIALSLLALTLVAAVPVALVVGVLLMLLGHVIGGLALFGGSILAATAAIVLAGVSGVRHVRRLVAEHSFRVDHSVRVLPLGSDDYTYVS